MNLTPSTVSRATRLHRRPLARLVACLLFCFLMLKLAGASAEDSGLLQKARSGDPQAEVSLGVDYQQGIDGFPQDIREAILWYRKAAGAGNAWAMYDLGALYKFGVGVPKDPAQSLAWDRKSADLGLAEAQVELGLRSQFGTGGAAQSYENAAYWYMKAAQQGNAWGEFDIGVCYAQGTCERQNYRQEYLWTRKAADQNLPRAQCTMAGLYLYGWGVSADRQQAQSWFEKAGGAKGCVGVDRSMWVPLASGIPPGPKPSFLPCQIAQNADRPCTNQEPSYVPTGVDGGLVGTWEIVTPTPAGTARWVWEIHQDGTYRFHAEGPGAVPGHSGTFAASQGHYALNSTTTNWNDAGTYQLTDSATLLATGKLGSGTWHRVQPKKD